MSLADLYSALADPTRLRMLELLHDQPRPVHQLAGAFDISRPAISRHLRVLREAGLVKEVKQGRENLYSFQRDKLKPGVAWLEKHLAKAPVKPKPKVVEKLELAAAPKPKTAAEPIEAPKPVARRKAVPKPAPQPIASPPRQTPQLSFFDL
ncbi:MAG: winged helix-turn-helix transcriptional regulator [Devosia sp.]|uniref:ArsR/SmtB family transcription factor n=1 Tax=Devosia sp. TaxID=1871048 RepID=UPI0026046CDC|nr:metalloregulator ArsR/SmtB family transcription factor [Devosia sp.]MDB5541215.1 winged helix-turn-helix transcriptional regulator [Devosia sp.]